LRHVPVDFERETLTRALAAAGFRRGEGAFFSWLAVRMYLSREAIDATVAEVAALASPGGALVLDFVIPASALDAEEAATVATLAANSAKFGEPPLSFFEPAEMEALLRRAGFASVAHFGPAEARERYLRGRTDGSRMLNSYRLAKATTGPGPAVD
jgi:methyltransferase (TIGR00027 family)